MSSVYAPFREDVEDQHRQSIRHRYSAIAHPRFGDPFELDVEDCGVTFDSSWSPYIQASLTVKAPEDQETLDALDPRNGCRVSVFLGYVYDGFVEDVHLVADLHVRSRALKRPDNTVTLALASDEALAQDYKRLAWGPHAPLTGLNEFVTFHAGRAVLPGTPVVVSAFPAGYGAAELAGMIQDVGQDSLSMIADAAERLDARVFVDGDRTWRIVKKAELVGTTALKLITGGGGTILDADTVLTRGETDGGGFKNAVTIKYLWKDGAGVDKVIFGNAVVSSGPWASSAIGYNVLYLERRYPIASATLANAAAANVLKSRVGRGHQVGMGAHAAYWLRPGHTVTVQLPAGDQQRYLVRQVQFNPPDGSMTLALVQPATVSISTTSG